MAVPANPPVELPDGRRPVTFLVSVDLGTATVTVTGELDQTTAHHVLDGLAALTGTGHRRWSVDMGQVTFCDAAGLRSLVTGHHLARRHGSALVLERPSPCVHRLMVLVGLDRVLTMSTDRPCPPPAAGGQRPLPAAGPLRSARRVQSLPAGMGGPGDHGRPALLDG
ncbi:STAS domain-containing protein [Blastococcus sp. TF02A-35]|uniref:STAS domain-containing protein n=1 Tax=Blastococcus sp. TF02A-35 TaxID=2559612 RepID=UPI001073A8B9|nr:STAS domain-containing protein [Blastococcus sp. TF02A_35]TFV47459.1 anti-sigma factor antagonist [Blastococcus sp. TF02A_35]